MKKIFALLLALLLILPMIVACGEEESSSSSSSQQESSSSESNSTPAGSESSSTPPSDDPDPRPAWSSETDVLDNWNGKTLNVLATKYSAADGAGAPWAQMELNPTSFGETVNQKFLDRQALILDKYGVTVNWVPAMGAQSISGDITTAMTSNDVTYEIAYTRAFEVQALVSLVLDMAESDITFTKQDYYSQAAYESFTIFDHTLFTAGDFDFGDEQVAYMLFYNKDMAETLGIPDLYEEVKKGTWTYDTLKNLSKNVSGDTNGNGVQDDGDTYGFATKNVTRFYQYAGIFQADVDPDTGAYRVSLNLDQTKVGTVVQNIIECVAGKDWARQGQDASGVNGWGGSWGANATVAFNEGRVLFLDEVAQNFDNIGTLNFSLGVLPFPKLNKDQTQYYAPTTREQTTFVCVPKSTADKEMSFYFVDVLAWTGRDYVMEAYYDKVSTKLDMTTREADMEILKNYVFDNIVYDVGMNTGGWQGLLDSVTSSAHNNGTDNFAQLYQEAIENAEGIVQTWNEAWQFYSEE